MLYKGLHLSLYLGLTDTKVYAEDEVNELIKHLRTKTASGGGDCSEYSFDGMISSLYEDSREGSPLYVFTDAPPKDANEDNKETMSALADELGFTINFFAGKSFVVRRFKSNHIRRWLKHSGGNICNLIQMS